MNREQEILSRAMNYLDDDMIVSAHAPRKKLRRGIPVLAAACLVAVTVAVYPFLREVIDTNSNLFDSAGNKADEDLNGNEAEMRDPSAPLEASVPYTLGGNTLTLTEVTETTATFTLVKTDDQPLYAALYGLRDDVLASTEPNFKADGVSIRPNTIRLTVNGGEEVYELPSAPGTYRIVADFSIIRNGTYPMEEVIGLYAYIGEDGQAVTLRFPLTVTPAETDTDAQTAAETE